MAKGDVIYTVREMKPSEHRLVAEQIKASHLRIIWQHTYPPDEVANRALSMVGCDFGGYNFLSNNCEHFANWCACGRRISQQVMFREK